MIAFYVGMTPKEMATHVWNTLLFRTNIVYLYNYGVCIVMHSLTHSAIFNLFCVSENGPGLCKAMNLCLSLCYVHVYMLFVPTLNTVRVFTVYRLPYTCFGLV